MTTPTSLPAILIYDSLSAEKKRLEPIEAGLVKMYVCGITVYDLCHIGHARWYMVYDTIVRYIRSQGYRVTFAVNITDVDDKIIIRAAENNESIEDLTARTVADMHADFDALGTARPDLEPRATDNIAEMIALIETLVEKGLAYQASSGDMLYRVRQFDGYGKLSKKDIDDLRAGERIAVDTDKEDPLDFVLWKASKPDEPSWPSPFGNGRPGWHIECSAMSAKHLGKQFDIHGGGLDLKFPHHENEIAQSEGAHNCALANIWMHNGLINIDGEKMSKSLGNFFTIREVLAKYHPEVIRGFMLGTHYRRPLNFSDVALDESKKVVDKFYAALAETNIGQGSVLEDYQAAFDAKMRDDFNAPGAIAVLHEVANALRKAKAAQSSEIDNLAKTLVYLGQSIGWLQTTAEAYLTDARTSAAGDSQISDAEIEAKIAERAQARIDKDYARADAARDWLAAHNIIIEDSPEGTSWSRG